MIEADYVLKLGGSAITHKDTPFSANTACIRRLAKEISGSVGKRIILVYGGGSFGHAAAIRHLSGGLVSSPSGIAEVRAAMLALTMELTRGFMAEGVPIFALNPSSCLVFGNGGSIRFGGAAIEAIEKALEGGLIPAMGGDIILDRGGGARILSGDTIARMLALRFRVKTLAFGTDVDGVLGPSGAIRAISRAELPGVIGMVGGRSGDVTGGMSGKLAAVRDYLSRGGREVLIFNACKPGTLARALSGSPEGTLIK
ncbi:MAG TPA: isopentenyl phosphate kinase [Candidatus Methanomethylicus sp.]|jgi:isopentenyl phosphate kinase|nr:isopentenyl phosphate kinase [Candidatus Methanomethylicus sp.]HRR55063.1 isopentenyl phosphate kinase [Candidatus Methanomethylicus sp.]